MKSPVAVNVRSYAGRRVREDEDRLGGDDPGVRVRGAVVARGALRHRLRRVERVELRECGSRREERNAVRLSAARRPMDGVADVNQTSRGRNAIALMAMSGDSAPTRTCQVTGLPAAAEAFEPRANGTARAVTTATASASRRSKDFRYKWCMWCSLAGSSRSSSVLVSITRGPPGPLCSWARAVSSHRRTTVAVRLDDVQRCVVQEANRVGGRAWRPQWPIIRGGADAVHSHY